MNSVYMRDTSECNYDVKPWKYTCTMVWFIIMLIWDFVFLFFLLILQFNHNFMSYTDTIFFFIWIKSNKKNITLIFIYPSFNEIYCSNITDT